MPYRKETKTDPSTKYTTKFEYAIAWMLEHLGICVVFVVACILLPLFYEKPDTITLVGILTSIGGVGGVALSIIGRLEASEDDVRVSAKKAALMSIGVVFVGAMFLAGGFVHRQYFEEAPKPRPAPKCKVQK